MLLGGSLIMTISTLVFSPSDGRQPLTSNALRGTSGIQLELHLIGAVEDELSAICYAHVLKELRQHGLMVGSDPNYPVLELSVMRVGRSGTALAESQLISLKYDLFEYRAPKQQNKTVMLYSARRYDANESAEQNMLTALTETLEAFVEEYKTRSNS